VKVAIVSRHLPDTEGSAAGRVLEATRRGLAEIGVDVTVHSWGPDAPGGPLPPGCTWEPLAPEPRVRTRLQALWRPRADAVRSRVEPPDGAVLIADDPLSHAALATHGDVVTTLHYLTVLDRATGDRRWRPADLQDVRAERRIVGGSAAVLSYSERVAVVARRWAAGPVTTIPAALVMPDEPAARVEEPVAGLLADWRWRPNQAALAVLLRAWPDVRERVPGARLLLGGRGDPSVGALPGVSFVGSVADSGEVLNRLAVLAFPCPPSSGPKVKVLEALASGLAVVTTPPGMEGLEVGDDAAWVGPEPRFADLLARALQDPSARATRATAARAAVAATHAPRPAALLRRRALRAVTTHAEGD
jgi:glycosyltransferase involved in cell wall biosynthesis